MACCSRLNKFTMPRIVLLVLHTVLLVFQQSWIMLLLSLPATLWQVKLKLKVSGGDFGVYDPTKIIAKESLRACIKESLLYMGYHLLCFFVFMWQLVSLLSPDQNSIKPSLHSEVPW